MKIPENSLKAMLSVIVFTMAETVTEMLNIILNTSIDMELISGIIQ